MDLDKSSVWKEWYSEKGTNIEPEIPQLELLLRQIGGIRILDFGCGAGRHSLYFAKKGFEVSGFDFSRDGVNQALSLMQDENLRADLRVWDMSSGPLPYDAGYFDAVVVVRVIHHGLSAEIKKVVSEIDRVIRLGGFIYLQEPAYDKAFDKDGSPKFESYEVLEPGTFLEHLGREKGIPRHYFKEEELAALFSNYKVLEHHEGSTHFRGHCLIAKKVENL